MRRRIRDLVGIVVVVSAMIGAMAGAASTPLPTEFTSGGVRWGDSTSHSGFNNEGYVCTNTDAFAMSDATLLSTGQSDAFDDAGVVSVGGTYYVAPGGVNGPVDLAGETLTAPPAPTGPLTVGVEWQGAGPNTIRELVSLANPGTTDVTQVVTVETDMGSDTPPGSGTFLQAASNNDISGFPSNARWFVTSDSNTTPGDPVVVSVAAGPGDVVSPANVVACPGVNSVATSKAADKAATSAAGTTTTTSGDVAAAGTLLNTDLFQYTYNVTVPAGQTRYLMMFWALYSTNAEGVAAGPTWNSNPAAGSPALAGTAAATSADVTASAASDVSALAGLTQIQLSQIVNWNFALTVQPRFTG